MKLLIFLIVLFGTIYFIQQRFSSLSVEDSYLKAENLSNPTIQKNGGSVVINFSLCKPEQKRFDVAFGSTTIQIVGKSDNLCVFKYGGEVENPKWDGKLPNFCRVPVSLGIVEFPTHQYGADYSAIGEFCVKK